MGFLPDVGFGLMPGFGLGGSHSSGPCYEGMITAEQQQQQEMDRGDHLSMLLPGVQAGSCKAVAGAIALHCVGPLGFRVHPGDAEMIRAQLLCFASRRTRSCACLHQRGAGVLCMGGFRGGGASLWLPSPPMSYVCSCGVSTATQVARCMSRCRHRESRS